MFNIEKTIGKNFECIPLQWDTDYFGVKSARINLNGVIDEADQNEIINFCKDYEFITISNISNIKENNRWIGIKTTAFLTDMNIQFVKGINEEPLKIDENTSVCNSYPRNEEIINMAKNSFQYSRFFNDSKLPTKLASNVYLHWTECAFDKENRYFVVSKKNNQVVGYILFSLDNEKQISTIELIAVHGKFRGQRVGKALIEAMESFVYKNNIITIKVGTQVDNIFAAQFYTSLGFKYKSCGAVYHLWNTKKEISR